MNPETPTLPLAAVIGGGPAGLRAAEVLVERAGGAWRVELFERKPSVGRKFLVAGRGGLNLTHSEARARFVSRYGGQPDDADRWSDLLAEFGPEELRAWAAGLGVETFVGTSGRVFPVGKQAAGLLRRWVVRLRERGVVFHVRHRWEELTATTATDADWRLGFQTDAGRAEVTAATVVFALGGASWPDTGSDGQWPERLGVPVAPWQAANCGWETAWRPEFLAVAEGLPLKNLALRAGAGGTPVRGEALVTRYGLEGGAMYQLGPALRAMGDRAELRFDLKPDADPDALAARLPTGDVAISLDTVAARWRLAPAARALLEFHGPGRSATRAAWLDAVKSLPLPLCGPRPVAEAISSAGGVRWTAVDGATLGLRDRPGVFVAGEMIDWEAPTGGYLLQGCFATGTRAGRGAAEFMKGGRWKAEGGASAPRRGGGN